MRDRDQSRGFESWIQNRRKMKRSLQTSNTPLGPNQYARLYLAFALNAGGDGVLGGHWMLYPGGDRGRCVCLG